MTPTDQQIKELHKKYAKSDVDLEIVYTHCRIVEAHYAALNAKPTEGVDTTRRNVTY